MALSKRSIVAVRGWIGERSPLGAATLTHSLNNNLVVLLIIGYINNRDVVKVHREFYTMATTQHASTKQDILQHLLRQGQATAQELAESLTISPQAVRRHLKDLADSGLIEYEAIQTGMGRPQHQYSLSREGREQFPHRYGEFTVSLIDTLVETVGREQVGMVLRKQWERKALEYRDRIGVGSLRDRIERLVQMRQTEGYMAELHPPEPRHSSDPEQYIFAEHNCAISEVAESFPSVCGHELEMFAAILPDCTVERTQWINDGEHRCGYLIQAKLSNESAA